MRPKPVDGAPDAARASDVGLLRVEDLSTHFKTRDGVIRAVDGVNFSLDEGEVLGVVGESGCGKSVMAQSVLRILPEPLGRIVGGHIHYRRAAGDTVDLAGYKAGDEELRALRGSEISMVFQEPMNSLHPIKTVGAQIIEAILLHQKTDKKTARERAVELIDRVGIAAPARRVDDYPGQMSGGMRQRVMIAMALSCNPRLLLADEPTTALDVTIQAQIVDLMMELHEAYGMSLVVITHNMGLVARMAQRVAVMYLGRIVELTDVHSVFKRPLHPYTQGLLRSMPLRGLTKSTALEAIEGRTACLLANHGMIVLGESLAKAMWRAVELETIARQYVFSLMIGAPVLLSEQAIDETLRGFSNYGVQPARKNESQTCGE